jgi:hypothetical protein
MRTYNDALGSVGCDLKVAKAAVPMEFLPAASLAPMLALAPFTHRPFGSHLADCPSMPYETSSQGTTFGYLSAIRTTEHGYFGGYLIISLLGRPLEFHCSAPLRPSRAQEILYGPTLEPFLLGDQIGGVLLSRAKLSPRLVITDQPAVLSLRDRIPVPLVQLIPKCDGSADIPTHLANPGRRFSLCDCEFDLPPGFEADRDTAMQLLTALAERVEFAEPFERIREAICEAQRIGNRGQDDYGHAA